MAAAPAVKVKRALALDSYDVFMGAERIGEIRKKVTRYSLRRSVTTTGWWGTLEVGETRARVPEGRGEFGTRRDAVAALVAAFEALS